MNKKLILLLVSLCSFSVANAESLYKNVLFWDNRGGYTKSGESCLTGAEAGKAFTDSTVVSAADYFNISKTGTAAFGSGTVALYPDNAPVYGISGGMRILCSGIDIGAWGSDTAFVKSFTISGNIVCGDSTILECPDYPGTATGWFWEFSETDTWTAGSFSVVAGSENAVSIVPSFGAGYYRAASVKECDTSYVAVPVNVTVVALPSVTVPADTMICYGSIYTYKGIEYTDDTVIRDTVRYAVSGCDSVYIIVDLTVSRVDTADIYDTVCYGGSYVKNGFEILNAISDSVYYNVAPNIHGCDSVTKLTLTVGETLETDPYLYDYQDNAVRIYPNPVVSGGILTLETDMVRTKSSEAAVYNLHGRQIKTFTLSEGQRILHIPITMPQGIYLLRTGNKVQKFVVIR
jgi:hypothetical protein